MVRVMIVARCKCGDECAMVSEKEQQVRKALYEKGWRWKVKDRHREEFTCESCREPRVEDQPGGIREIEPIVEAGPGLAGTRVRE